MKKYIGFAACFIFIICIYAYANSMNSETEVTLEAVTDYPAAIMVDGEIYLLEGLPMPAEIDDSVIIGYTESYTDTFPEKDGETNFNRGLFFITIFCYYIITNMLSNDSWSFDQFFQCVF